MLPLPTQPAPDDEGRPAAGHVQGGHWPACRCRLCLDEHICPAAVARAGRALVLAAALGVVAVVVGPL